MSNILHSGGRSLTAPMMFSALPGTLQESLLGRSRPRSFNDGEIIQQRGDAAEGFYLIERGSVSVGQFLPDGHFRAVALLGAGDSWGELAMLAGRPRVVDAVARGDCVVRHIRSSVFEDQLRTDPTAMRALLSALSQQLQELLDVVAGIRSGSARARVAALLITLSDSPTEPAQIALSQQELGELLGLTRATVNAALKAFEKDGAVQRSYGAVQILDREALSLAALA